MAGSVVVGGSPGAMRAAALLASKGESVTLLTPVPLEGLVLPEGSGVWEGDGGEAARTLYGSLQPIDSESGLWFRGRVWRLPLKAETLARLVPPGALFATGAGWASARAAIELAELIGGGHEQRTYAHWIGRRFGNAALKTLYASYCFRRFGEPEALSCNVARLFHGHPRSSAFAPTRPLHLGSVNVVVGVATGIGEGWVESSGGRIEGRVFVDLLPATTLKLMGEPAESAAMRDAERLRARHRITVCLKAEANLPRETHVLDDQVRFYRILQPQRLPGFEGLAGRLCLHYALEDSAAQMPDSSLVEESVDGLRRMGISADASGATVQRGASDQPLWEGVHLSCLRRHMMVLEEKGITPIGRSGLHSFADPSAELRYLDAVTSSEKPALRVALRDFVEPPVEDPPRAHLRRFVER